MLLEWTRNSSHMKAVLHALLQHECEMPAPIDMESADIPILATAACSTACMWLHSGQEASHRRRKRGKLPGRCFLYIIACSSTS